MKVLIITGNLAYPLIKNVVANANVEVIIHIADNTQVAAFLTPRIIIDEIKTHFANQLEEIDMILVPWFNKKKRNQRNNKKNWEFLLLKVQLMGLIWPWS